MSRFKGIISGALLGASLMSAPEAHARKPKPPEPSPAQEQMKRMERQQEKMMAEQARMQARLAKDRSRITKSQRAQQETLMRRAIPGYAERMKAEAKAQKEAAKEVKQAAREPIEQPVEETPVEPLPEDIRAQEEQRALEQSQRILEGIEERKDNEAMRKEVHRIHEAEQDARAEIRQEDKKISDRKKRDDFIADSGLVEGEDGLWRNPEIAGNEYFFTEQGVYSHQVSQMDNETNHAYFFLPYDIKWKELQTGWETKTEQDWLSVRKPAEETPVDVVAPPETPPESTPAVEPLSKEEERLRQEAEAAVEAQMQEIMDSQAETGEATPAKIINTGEDTTVEVVATPPEVIKAMGKPQKAEKPPKPETPEEREIAALLKESDKARHDYYARFLTPEMIKELKESDRYIKYALLQDKIRELDAGLKREETEAVFQQMQYLKLPLALSDYQYAANAAAGFGDVVTQRERLTLALNSQGVDSSSDEYLKAKAELEAIDATYGRVILIKQKKYEEDQEPLLPALMPEDPIQRWVAYWAMEANKKIGDTVEVLLPAGEYDFGENHFVVVPGQPVQIIRETTVSSEIPTEPVAEAAPEIVPEVEQPPAVADVDEFPLPQPEIKEETIPEGKIQAPLPEKLLEKYPESVRQFIIDYQLAYSNERWVGESPSRIYKITKDKIFYRGNDDTFGYMQIDQLPNGNWQDCTEEEWHAAKIIEETEAEQPAPVEEEAARELTVSEKKENFITSHNLTKEEDDIWYNPERTASYLFSDKGVYSRADHTFEDGMITRYQFMDYRDWDGKGYALDWWPTDERRWNAMIKYNGKETRADERIKARKEAYEARHARNLAYLDKKAEVIPTEQDLLRQQVEEMRLAGQVITLHPETERALERMTPEEKKAESLRLIEEIGRLSTKNEWGGIEEKYRTLLKLSLPIPSEIYYLASQAARDIGDTEELYKRLKLAQAARAEQGENPELSHNMDAVELDYGRVIIKNASEGELVLQIAEPPFARDKSQAYTYARQMLKTPGAVYYGWLPVGSYTIGDVSFVVDPSRQPDEPKQVSEETPEAVYIAK
ncbi:MAG: hypothetical protein WC752_04705 [Patescibacteria group bacterium]|jgi:hypothetical protein